MISLSPTYIKKIAREPVKTVVIKKYTSDSLEQLQTVFSETDWSVFDEEADDVERIIDVITGYIVFNQEMFLTEKKIKIFPNNKPWFDGELRAKSIEKHRAFGSSSFLQAKKEFNQMVKKKKRDYADKIEDRLESKDMGKVFHGIKNLIGMNKAAEKGIDPELGEKLNHFYARFDIGDFSEERSALKENLLSKEISNIITPTFEISEDDTIKALNSINVQKSCGPDQLKGSILKNCRYQLAAPFTSIFNKCFKYHTFPTHWKEATIIPVPKRKGKDELNNFRPIALTSILGKCFEKIIKKRLIGEIKTDLDPFQFAYRKARGTDDALATLFQSILKHLDESSTNYVRLLLLDFSSAFNTILPHVLVQKLIGMGVSSTLSLIILDFLGNRPQRVRTNTGFSSYTSLCTGSPQGCILSPFLFTLYTDELRSDTPTSILLKYADDVAIVGLLGDVKGKETELKFLNTIKKSVDWCKENNLILNEEKTRELVFDFRRNVRDIESIKVNEKVIVRTNECKYLGITIDDKLMMGKHVAEVRKKLQKRMFVIKKLKGTGISRRLVTVSYISFVESLCRYGHVIIEPLLGNKNKRQLFHTCREANQMKLRKLPDFTLSLEKQTEKFATKILKDSTHPLHKALMDHSTEGRRKWKMPSCRTSRYLNSFIPQILKRWSGTRA